MTGTAQSEDTPEVAGRHAPSEPFGTLAVGAIGVVFGDIGTSPLYSLKESFVGHHHSSSTSPTSMAC